MAHSANTMDLHYYESTTNLSVYITHGVSDRNYHFTENITIRINGTIELTEIFTSQPGITINHYDINLAAQNPQNHDIINVTAICSLFGVYSKEMIVGEVHELHEGSFLTALPFVFIGTLITAGIFAIPYVTNRNPEKSKNKKKSKK
jgi:hypothetical protein